jgi:hypothetical protein
MSVFIGLTVVHRVAVNHVRGVGLTACGIRFSLADANYIEVVPGGMRYDDERLLAWVDESYGRFVAACSHCRDREPAWERRRRKRERATRVRK